MVGAKLYVPGWNLGDVRITDGVQNLCDSNSMGELSIGDLLEAHFRGDYGLVNEDATDIARTRQAKSRDAQLLEFGSLGPT